MHRYAKRAGLLAHHEHGIENLTCYFEHHSVRGSKNPKPEFSRITAGGSTSAMSTCCNDLEMSSTVKGMLY